MGGGGGSASGGGGRGGGVVLKPVLLARNLTLNYDAVPNYKRSAQESSTTSVQHHSETYNLKYCDETKQRVQWCSEARTQENLKQDHVGTDQRH